MWLMAVTNEISTVQLLNHYLALTFGLSAVAPDGTAGIHPSLVFSLGGSGS